MIERILIISLFAFGTYCTFQEEMIFEGYGKWIEKNFGDYWCKPLGCCIVCFTFWWGSILYLILWRIGPLDWFVSVVAAMGLNYVLTRLFNDN